MTPYYTIDETAKIAFGIAAMFAMTGAIVLLISACALGQKRRYVLGAAVLCAAVLFLFQGIADVNYLLSNGVPFALFARVTGEMPAVVLAVLLALAAGVEAAAMTDLARKRENTLTPNAIKESLDTLPDGICFFADDGQPLLVNTQMHRLSRSLFDTDLLNAERFWDGLKGKTFKADAQILQTEPTVTIRIGEESVWDFRRNRLRVGRSEISELVAFHVTEQYRLRRELDTRNQRLSQVNVRLRQYSQEVERVTAENEILNAKIQVHDDVGRALLAFRSYFAQPEESRNRESVLLLWRYTIGVLKKETVPARQRDGWQLLQEAAKAVDVAIELNGKLPEAGTAREICMTALHECLTNTVKHAEGNRLFLSVREGPNGFTVELTNNGRQPKGEIRETGGLKNLRHTVESAGGEMTIETAPRFVVRLEIPKGEGCL